MDDDNTVEEVVACCNCTLLIHKVEHIKCSECDVFLCIPCFRMGCELPGHQRGHNYEVINPLGQPLFEAKDAWGFTEEDELLNAARSVKLGNWAEMTEMMKHNRPNDVQEYFDRYFIRGTLGQFALQQFSWPAKRDAMIADGSLPSLYSDESGDRVLQLLLANEALLASDETLTTNEDRLLAHIADIVQKHVSNLMEKFDHQAYFEETHKAASVPRHISDDSCDESDSELKDEETDSFMGDAETPSTSTRKDRMMNGSDSHMKKSSLRKPVSHPVSTPRSGMKYKRIVHYSSSDEEEEVADNSMNGTRSHVDDGCGLERERSSDSDRLSDENSNLSAVERNRPQSSRRRKKQKIVSKKQRRLYNYTMKMARQNKERARRLDESRDVCSMAEMRTLRENAPLLALYGETSTAEKPKLRNDDLKMLLYNPDRDDFEVEWFNDAEQLISRLVIQTPKTHDRMLDIENEIKFARIQHYIRILQARKAKHRAITEHDKITEFFNFMKDKTVDQHGKIDDMDVREKLMKRIQQTLTREELDEFASKSEEMENLCERIAKLRSLQKQGITTLKGSDKQNLPTPCSTQKKRKKGPKYNSSSKRKAQLRWQAFKRNQLQYYNDVDE